MSTAWALFEDAERRRERAGVSVKRVVLGGSFDHRSYVHIKARRALRMATARRWAHAVDDAIAERRARNPEQVLRAAIGLLAKSSNNDALAVLAQDFSVQRPTNKIWKEAVHLRRLAIWLCVRELSIERVPLARAMRTTRQTIKLAVDWVEEARDDPAVVALLGHVAKIMGAADAETETLPV